MIALLYLYMIITVIVATVWAVLWAGEILDGGSLASILAHAGAILTAPLWPLFLVWVAYTLVTDAMTSLKGNE